MADTRQRLIDGTIETIRTHGLTGASARTIAATAGVNQALVFYHFGSVHDLLKAACLTATEAKVAPFVERLDGVTDLRQLLALGRALHTEERAEGNVMVLGQLLAGAQTDPQLAESTAAALQLWITPIERALARLLAGSPVAEVIDTAGLARAVCRVRRAGAVRRGRPGRCPGRVQRARPAGRARRGRRPSCAQGEAPQDGPGLVRHRTRRCSGQNRNQVPARSSCATPGRS